MSNRIDTLNEIEIAAKALERAAAAARKAPPDPRSATSRKKGLRVGMTISDASQTSEGRGSRARGVIVGFDPDGDPLVMFTEPVACRADEVHSA